ncbi:MAG: hypothetical protein IJ816_01095 [Alloprevotella sp.]|nr:hypothetical protein [Alloprevotella sp.]
MDFKVNEYGEIIREDNELLTLEQEYLKGVPLNIKVRKQLAAESQNSKVLEACLKERAITVRRIVWDNPHLPPEMRKEATRQKLLDKGRNSKTEHKDNGEANCCLWFFIIVGLLIGLFSYLSGEMWFREMWFPF